MPNREEEKTTYELLLAAFSREELDRLLRFELHLQFDHVVRASTLQDEIFQLVCWASRNSQLGTLVQKAAEERPKNPQLQGLARTLATTAPAPPAAPTRDLVGGAVAALEQVKTGLSDAGRRTAFQPFLAKYREAGSRLAGFKVYKALHDCLHIVQLQYPEIARASLALADEEGMASCLELYANTLEDAAEGKDAMVAALENPDPERRWLGNLNRSVNELREAADPTRPDPARAEEAIRLLDRVLDREPARIHGILVGAARGLPLPDLIFSLRWVIDHLPPNEPTPDELLTSAGEETTLRRRVVENGLTALETLQLRLARLVADHTAWQNLDNAVRLAQESWHQYLAVERRRARERRASSPVPVRQSNPPDEDRQRYVDRLLEDWPDVVNKFASVRENLQSHSRIQRMDGYAAQLQTAVESRNHHRVFEVFPLFCQQAVFRFVEIDRDLEVLK